MLEKPLKQNIENMAKILYTINGDGMGHTTRSIPIIQALIKKHTVQIITTSEKSYAVVKKKFSNVQNIEGVHFIYKNNSVDTLATILHNAKTLLKRDSPLRVLYAIVKKFHPDIIITDFEHLTLYISKLFSIPVICICNIHAVTELKYTIPQKYKKAYYGLRLGTTVGDVNIKEHIIMSFFDLPTKRKNTTLIQPILRPEITSAKPQVKNHILVYQTSNTNTKLISTLKKIPESFIVYGFNQEKKDNNITYRKFNENIFFEDFKNCKACIANGGFSFISEAIALKKPILSIPIKGQFEQILNAMQIEKLGYGEHHDTVNVKQITTFLTHLPTYYTTLQNREEQDNENAIKKINEVIKKYATTNKKNN